MKIYKLALLYFFLIFTLILGSCHSFKDLEFKEYKNLKLEKLGFSNTSLSAELNFYNPNNFGLELNETNLDIYINENLLGHSSQMFQVKIPKRGNFNLPLKIDLDMKNLLKNSLTSLFNKEVTIKTVGKIRAGKAGFFRTVPFEYTTQQKLSPF